MSEIKQRNISVDVIKGTAIVLMVAVHGGSPGSGFINLFHMAVFFIASGYFWNVKNAQNLTAVKKYIIRKIKGIWLPFFLCNAVFTVLNNFFISIGFYTSDKRLLSLTTLESNYLHHSKTIAQTAKAVLKNVVFLDRTQLATPTWFLGVLFVVVLMRLVLEFLLKSFKYKTAVYCVVLAGCLGASTLVSIRGIKLPANLQAVFAAYIAYVIGILLRRYDAAAFFTKHRAIKLILSLGVLTGMSFVGKISFSSGYITDVVFFIIVSTLGWSMLWLLAELLPKPTARFFAYLGRSTMPILLLHPLCFKLVSWLYIVFSDKDPLLLAAFPRIENAGLLWIAYTVVGTALPLLINFVYKSLKDRVKLVGNAG